MRTRTMNRIVTPRTTGNGMTVEQQLAELSRRHLNIDLTEHATQVPCEVTVPMLRSALLEIWKTAERTGYKLGYEQGGTEMREAIMNRVDEI